MYNKIGIQYLDNNRSQHWIDTLQRKGIKIVFNLANYLNKTVDRREKLLALPN